MPRKITLIHGHPGSARRHLCHALADGYADAAAQAGHSITRVKIAGIEFPMLRTQEESNSGAQPASLKPAVDAIVSADHIVLVFSLWLGTMPALVKAFLEQVIRPGVPFPTKSTAPKNCWLAAPLTSSLRWECRPGCTRHTFAAMAFAGCVEAYSSLPAYRRSERPCSA